MSATPEDLMAAVAADSDQLGADDLTGGPLMGVVQRVVTRRPTRQKGDQPWDVHLSGWPKPWRPCKTMRRLLLHCWGSDLRAWVGRGIRLYREAAVSFGGEPVGGIRVSGLSHLDGPRDVALTETRGRKRTWHVDQLPAPPPPKPGPS